MEVIIRSHDAGIDYRIVRVFKWGVLFLPGFCQLDLQYWSPGLDVSNAVVSDPGSESPPSMVSVEGVMLFSLTMMVFAQIFAQFFPWLSWSDLAPCGNDLVQ